MINLCYSRSSTTTKSSSKNETIEILESEIPPATSDPSPPTLDAYGDSSTVSDGSIVLENERYRTRHFPATKLPDYPGGIPVLRRRSLHPKNEKIPDPYEEFYIRSPKWQAEQDSKRIISRVMSRQSMVREPLQLSSRRKPFLQPLWDFLARSASGLFGIVCLPFAVITALAAGSIRKR